MSDPKDRNERERVTRSAAPRKKKAREWTLCVNDGSYKSSMFQERLGEVWGDRRTRPHFKAPHEHVHVREVLPRKKARKP